MNLYDVWLVNRYYGTGRKKCAPIKAKSSHDALATAQVIYQPERYHLVMVSLHEGPTLKHHTEKRRVSND